ncbi:hypothetical protein AUK40_01345 [Candidatus Wirthbacteria bacterium CG2_30_54_11]|uniref:Uncharacterized protein n=1 Tax=Candidatus Wirthbacteria bacterium CG2_30_54_11 TaxID=1817892 RepID=A0A1J5IN84_9BACT|nr:MAG: hypothetical protein AUK40_01345 [Candidatus Wirthbacteria bacterium CG2_30_54_11]
MSIFRLPTPVIVPLIRAYIRPSPFDNSLASTNLFTMNQFLITDSEARQNTIRLKTGPLRTGDLFFMDNRGTRTFI